MQLHGTRLVILLGAALMLVVGSLVPLTSPVAHAAQNTDIEVTLETNPLVLTDKDGVPVSPQRAAIVEEPVQIKFSWDATNANPQPGQSFVVALPAEYRFREGGRTDDLLLDDDTKVGQCVTSSWSLTCTFDAGITAANELKGSVTQMLVAQKVTQTNTVNFDLNGTGTTVFHPNREPVRPITWSEKNLGKYANTLMRDSAGLTWHIQFSGRVIADHLQVPHGTVSSVTFEDVTGGGQVLNSDPASWYLVVNPESLGGGPDGYVTVMRADGTVHSTDYGTFTLTPSIGADGTTASVTLTRTDGTLDNRTNYEIVYQSLAEGGKIVPGRVYSNTATLQGGRNTALTASMSYTDPISYDISLTQGFGSFGVKKYVTGAYQNQVTSDTKVRVNVAYTLPAGSTEANFPTWTNKPASNPYTVEIPVGTQQADNLFEFPQGTEVTLTEDTSAATLPTGLAWSNVLFSVNGTETPDTVTFTIASGNVTTVGLYNEVVQEYGSFTLVKKVSGDNADAFSAQDYRIHYTCGSTTGSHDVPGNGTPVVVPVEIAVGTECTVTEETDADAQGSARTGYSVKTEIDNGTFTVASGDASATVITVTNTYTQELQATATATDPATSTSATSSTSVTTHTRPLARTGVSTLLLVGAAGALAAGGALRVARRRGE